MKKQHYSCSFCGSVKISKNGFDLHGKQRFYCDECGSSKAPFKNRLTFKGRHGVFYTVRSIIFENERRCHPISYNTAIYRIKAAIKDPSKEDGLFDPPSNKPKDLWKMESETLTGEQRAMMEKFRAVVDGRMSINDL